ncbi:MAG: precorrin-8X methylmutase [SAR324 cluster bacterium]|nr:precorrin-8X methylmutase [SAR324 cluster bacterium]
MTTSKVTEQITQAGRQIEEDSFAIVDREAGDHTYGQGQWEVVRRLIHASADFDFNGLVKFHPDAVTAGVKAVTNGAKIITDVEMICVGLSKVRMEHFGMAASQYISDDDVIEEAKKVNSTRAVQAMRKAHRLGLLDGSIVGIGNAPTALIELIRLINEEGAKPALIVGMPVGFVSAAESKEMVQHLKTTPWIVIQGRKGGSPLVVSAIHALMTLAQRAEH